MYPPQVAVTNLMRAVGAVSVTTQGFLQLYRHQVVTWTLTVPKGTPLKSIVRDFKRFARRLRRRYPDVHLLWTLAAHAPSFHPHIHFLANRSFSTGVMGQMLRSTCFGITFRRGLSREEYAEGSRYDYLAFNLYRTRTTNPDGLKHQRLWGVVAGKNVKASVRRETRSVQLEGPTARLWRKYHGHLLREIKSGLVARHGEYLTRFYGLPDDGQHHESVNVLLLSRPRSPRTGRRPVSFAQFQQRVLYRQFQRALPRLKARAFFAGFAVGFARAAALVMFYATLASCFVF